MDDVESPTSLNPKIAPGNTVTLNSGQVTITRIRGNTVTYQPAEGPPLAASMNRFRGMIVPERNAPTLGPSDPVLPAAQTAHNRSAELVSLAGGAKLADPPEEYPHRTTSGRRWTITTGPGMSAHHGVPKWLGSVALAFEVAGWVSVAVLVAMHGDQARDECVECGVPVEWRSSLLYKLANAACTHVPQPLHPWSEAIIMLLVLASVPILLFELAAKIENWSRAPEGIIDLWFIGEPCFFCGGPAGSGALQDIETFALVCSRCRMASNTRRTLGAIINAAAYWSMPFSFCGAFYGLDYLLKPVWRWADLSSSWWMLLVLPTVPLLILIPLATAIVGMALLTNRAVKVASRQPDYPEFDGNRWHWSHRPQDSRGAFWLGWNLPPRIHYGVPVQLPPYDLFDYSQEASRAWVTVDRRAWEYRAEFPELLNRRWPGQFSKDWSSIDWS